MSTELAQKLFIFNTICINHEIERYCRLIFYLKTLSIVVIYLAKSKIYNLMNFNANAIVYFFSKKINLLFESA